MTATSILAPCPHGRLRPHVWRCEDHPGCRFVVHGCWARWIPPGLQLVITGEDDEGIHTRMRLRDDPAQEVDLCRCTGGVIVELVDGSWRHLDRVLAENCLDTRPVEDP